MGPAQGGGGLEHWRCGAPGRGADAGSCIFAEAQHSSDPGWLHVTCRLEQARHLAKADAPQAVELAQQIFEDI